jgi:hypothetical protein
MECGTNNGPNINGDDNANGNCLDRPSRISSGLQRPLNNHRVIQMSGSPSARRMRQMAICAKHG